MKKIPLTQGKVALVDDEDFAPLVKHKWCALKSNSKLWYAVRSVSGTPKKTIYMHKELLPEAMYVDHKDGNGLNNQRSNLRPCTRSQNIGNKRKQANTASIYKGIFWRRDISKWVARIMCEGIREYLGSYGNEIDAARAYNEAAARLFGEFALLNSISAQELQS